MNCSFCIVPKTRGVERYRPMGDILEEVETLAESGVKEVLTWSDCKRLWAGEFPRADKKSPFVHFWKKSTQSIISKNKVYLSSYLFGNDLIRRLLICLSSENTHIYLCKVVLTNFGGNEPSV